MAKLVLIITSVLGLAAIGLGFVNRGSFIEVRNQKISDNESIQDYLNQTDEAITLLEGVQQQVTGAEGERDEALVGVDETGRKVENVKTQISGVDTKVKTKQNEITKIEKTLEPWDGIDISTLNDKLDGMKKNVADKEEEIAVLEREIEVAQSAVSANENTIAGYQTKQRARSAAISLDGSEATIQAVNNDWGFVVVNVGRSRGVPKNSRLLVKRGGEQIGRLAIVSIEPSMLIANIVQDSLKKGARVLPGDKVVFETGVK